MQCKIDKILNKRFGQLCCLSENRLYKISQLGRVLLWIMKQGSRVYLELNQNSPFGNYSLSSFLDEIAFLALTVLSFASWIKGPWVDIWQKQGAFSENMIKELGNIILLYITISPQNKDKYRPGWAGILMDCQLVWSCLPIFDSMIENQLVDPPSRQGSDWS